MADGEVALSEIASRQRSLVAYIVAGIITAATVSFLTGLAMERSLEAAFREWAFRTWWGAAIYVTVGVGLGAAFRWIDMWERRRKRKQQRDQSG